MLFTKLFSLMVESDLYEPCLLIILFMCRAKNLHTFPPTCRFFAGILRLQCTSFMWKYCCRNTQGMRIGTWIQLAQSHSHLYKACSSICIDMKNVQSMTQHWHLKSSILSSHSHAQLTSLFSSAICIISKHVMETIPYLGMVKRKVQLHFILIAACTKRIFLAY